jgi:Na+(H+)/acetate symporter ActP
MQRSVSAGAIMITWLGLMYSLVTAPLSPNPSTQNIIPFNNHGTIHFITPLQDKGSDVLVPIGIIVAIFGNIMRNKIKDSSPG